MLIECVPNVSEGRRPEVIESLASSLVGVRHATLIDISSDPDHNRTVLTLAGSPHGLKEAVRAIYTVALAAIDMRVQEGVHPRMGAVDVVPFIPVEGCDMDYCVALSREVAQEIAGEFDLPIFLYARSAASDSRRKLADIREGGFEAMAEKLRDPAWKPDFGPAAPHPTLGVSAMGARPYLIAYNIQLETPDLLVARSIARAVRESSGGLPFLQAMGVYLPARRQAQVSMNLLDYEKTPLLRVFNAVKAEAALRNTRVADSEIVGLIPKAALGSASPEDLQIENWRESLILENALRAKLSA
ncbi:MAG TPA: glutamate formimidoyltransferase [Capsulimonadaceae bacterium]|nr:glutamate formimidoyltransferase [Capsulimonadaceae bacterium]